MKKYSKLTNCRICKKNKLISVIDLGNFYISSWLTSNKQDKIPRAPLELSLCNNCKLIQLNHTVKSKYLYSS